MVRFDRRRKQINIRHEPSPAGCRVRVQPHAMQQVLVNVLLNAIDAVSQRVEPSIQIKPHCSEEVCRIDIIDNGTGIPPEDLERLFEPFFTTKPVGKGTGLGLAISYSLMRNQGGDIRVQSTPGQGTAVQLILLRADGPGCDGSDQACQRPANPPDSAAS
jgi:C4-dicarboxylate-specific signal transduction histidine kinase